MLLLLSGFAASSSAATSQAPSILVLMAEDLSARVGAFGDPVARTPNLDALADQGVRFPNTFTTAGVCAPSRAAFITGVHQISLGGQHMRTSTSPVARYMAVPAPEVKAFPEILRRAGYHTFTDRKLDYQFSGVFFGSGPETIWDQEGPDVDLDALPNNRPFFGLINFLITHESATFTPAAVAGTAGEPAAKRAAAARAALTKRTDPEAVAVPPYYPDEVQVRAHIADHYDNVQLMDAQVGAIVADLERLGRLDETIIIWTTDHGDAVPRAKRELFDSGIRVPMIIRWPEALQPAGLESGALDERLISFVDLAPMILAMAGVPAQSFHQGRDLFDPDANQREYIYASRDRMDEQRDRVRAVRDGRYKYLRYYLPDTPGAVHLAYRDQGRVMQSLWQHQAAGTLSADQSLWFAPRPGEALYDLDNDPHELTNLADDPAHLPTLTRLRSAYGAWRLRIPDLSDVSEAALAEQFWPGETQPQTQPPTFERLADGRIAVLAIDGASIEVNAGDVSSGADWRLYVEPLEVAEDATLSARAVRYGYALSSVASLSSDPVPAAP